MSKRLVHCAVLPNLVRLFFFIACSAYSSSIVRTPRMVAAQINATRPVNRAVNTILGIL